MYLSNITFRANSSFKETLLFPQESLDGSKSLKKLTMIIHDSEFSIVFYCPPPYNAPLLGFLQRFPEVVPIIPRIQPEPFVNSMLILQGKMLDFFRMG